MQLPGRMPADANTECTGDFAMMVHELLSKLAGEPIGPRLKKELGPVVDLALPVAWPDVWVIGQKKAGTSLAANFIAQGLFGRDAAIDLPVRRWLQRGLLPVLFRFRPKAALGVVARVQRARVVKEPNLCYYVKELVSGLDGQAALVYVTRDRVQHIRSVLDRLLVREGDAVFMRPDVNFVWRKYCGALRPGDRVCNAAIPQLIENLARHFDETESMCLSALSTPQSEPLIVRYEDILAFAHSGDSNGLSPESSLAELAGRWPQFNWQQARRVLGVQHQPKGARIIDDQLIEQVYARSA